MAHNNGNNDDGHNDDGHDDGVRALNPDVIRQAAQHNHPKTAMLGVQLNVAPEQLVFPPPLWGTVALRGPLGAPHLTLTMFRVAEGMVVQGRCGQCGGRIETLADGRDQMATLLADAGTTTPDRAQVHAFMDEHLLPYIQQHVEPALRIFAQAHRECDTRPRTYAQDAPVREFVQAAILGAEQQLQQGVTPPPVLWVLLDTNQALMVPLDQPVLPELHPEHGVDLLAQHQLMLREMTRLQGYRVRAAVLAAEAWVSERSLRDPMVNASEDPDRIEVLMFSVVTPEYGQIGYATIQRDGGVQDVGPGHLLRPLLWVPITEDHPVADTVMAGNTAPPMSAAARERLTVRRLPGTPTLVT